MSFNSKIVLGKIFISHSSQDKPFILKLVSELDKLGYDIRLDDRELLAGDPLSHKLSRAIAAAKVVIIVVSKYSMESRWLKYEINQAADKMVEGKCRLIPALIGEGEPPPEIGGLVYADFRKSFEKGLSKVLKTLDSEAGRYPRLHSFKSDIENLLREEFGSCYSGSISSEYKSYNFNFIQLEESIEIGYEIVSAFGDREDPISEGWWYEFSDVIADVDISFYLLITERPIGFNVEQVYEDTDGRIKLISTSSHIVDAEDVYVLIIDMSNLKQSKKRRELIRQARIILETRII